MYILGLSSSWGTSRIYPAWSPSEHQLTPALSPIWGPRPKPSHPEEVVYSPNGSCSHFTQRLFPPKLPQQHTCTILTIQSTSFISIIHHIHASNYIFYIHDMFTLSFLRIFIAGRLPSVPCVRYRYSSTRLSTSGFFSIIDPIWAPDSHPKIFSNSVSNWQRYSDLYVYQCCRIQRWFEFYLKIGKDFIFFFSI